MTSTFLFAACGFLISTALSVAGEAGSERPWRQIDRVRFDEMTYPEFLDRYHSKDIPVIITNATEGWDIMNWFPAKADVARLARALDGREQNHQ